MIRRPPISTLFPYTPLFLSGRDVRRVPDCDPACAVDEEVRRLGRQDQRFHARLVVVGAKVDGLLVDVGEQDRKSTRLNSSHSQISYAVFCLKKKKNKYDSRSPSTRLYHVLIAIKNE